MKKTMLTILLCGIMIFGVTGCGITKKINNTNDLNDKNVNSENNDENELEKEEKLQDIKIYDLLVNQANVDSSNENGVFMTNDTDSGSSVYYFKGTINNNYLILGNYCWRIVRTTETGGVKIIYSGTSNDNKCASSNSFVGTSKFNSFYNNNASVGYMYGSTNGSTYSETHANTNDSDVKTYIDNWFKNHLLDYQDSLEDTVFCNDRSISSGTGIGKKQTVYAADNRLSNDTPSLKCVQENDRFTVSTNNGNGALTYPVGLITLDEVLYAGNVGYLFTGSSEWTLTPMVYAEYGGASNGMIESLSSDYINTHNTLGIRPVISLKSNTEVYSGSSGTYDNPYIVK